MFILYIIHRGDTSELYKIGSHTGNLKCLISRYITAIPLLKLCLYIPFNNRKDLLSTESFMKSKYMEMRQRNINGNLSEWYELDEKLLKEVKVDIENACLKLNTIIIENETMSEQKVERKENVYRSTDIISLISMFREKRIITPSYQRERDSKRLSIIRKYMIDNISKTNFYMPEIVLNTRGDTYHIIDGQHRLHALLEASEEEIVMLKNLSIRCIVIHELNDEEEKQLFMDINKSVPCPQLYLLHTEKIEIMTKFIIDIKNTFGNNISNSNRPHIPNFNIGTLAEAIVHVRRDANSYIQDWYGDHVINTGKDLCDAFVSFNEYLGKKLTGTDGYRIYKLNCPRSADRHDEERFVSLLNTTTNRATTAVCYLGFMDTERLLRCIFNHGMLY